jgi:uncharacterized membrane protein YebE (DUF533 family)
VPDAESGGGPGGISLQDLLRGILAGGDARRTAGAGGSGGDDGSKLPDLLGELQQQLGRGGSLFDALGKVLGQATAGVREGAGRLDEATGASQQSRDLLQHLSGKSPEDILAQLKQMIASNPTGTGAALGGLGTLILGTEAGRSLAAAAAKLGGLALIGGLAYKAYQNYQQGQPAPTGTRSPPAQQSLLPAPAGSGFEPDAVSHDGATLLIRTMIAAAAADGRIDANEQKSILGGFERAGSAGEAQRFLLQEIEHPASPDDIAAEVSSPEQAVQVYTAARIAVDVDTEEEHAFLAALAERLGIDDALTAHIDAAARGAA